MTALTYAPSLRGDAMLLTHGRPGTERLIGAALLLDGVLGGQLDVTAHGLVTAGPERAEDALLAELRARVLAGPLDTPHGWIERAAGFAPSRVAAELVAAGLAAPHERRFQRGISVDASAEAAARDRLAYNPALAAALYASGLPSPALPPVTSFLPPAAAAVIAALR